MKDKVIASNSTIVGIAGGDVSPASDPTVSVSDLLTNNTNLNKDNKQLSLTNNRTSPHPSNKIPSSYSVVATYSRLKSWKNKDNKFNQSRAKVSRKKLAKKKFNLQEVYEYLEKHISIFHQRRLDYVQNKVDLLKILKQKNPYLFRAKNVLTAQDLIKGFLDAFLQSQEETLFGDFIEGLAIFVCDKVYGAKKSELTGIDLEFEKDGVMYIVEIKAGWNWGNSSQIRQLNINFENAKN